jgi:hypothetical protein
MKYCKHCKLFNRLNDTCMKHAQEDPITGRKTGKSANEMRFNDTLCGMSARWFEPLAPRKERKAKA